MAELIIADASDEMKCSDRDDLADKTRFAEWEPLHVREVVRPADHGITPPHHPDILKQPPPALESGRRGDGLAGPVWTVRMCVYVTPANNLERESSREENREFSIAFIIKKILFIQFSRSHVFFLFLLLFFIFSILFRGTLSLIFRKCVR